MKKIVFLFLSLITLATYAQTAFEKRIAELGFNEITTDWSDSLNITIPRPKCAYVNVTGMDNLPQKEVSQNGWMEVYDGNGNYFKKRFIATLQGKSSTKWAKKNFAADFCNDEWLNENTPDITIGDWVDQDSYHFKAFYNDFFRGTGIVAYSAYQSLNYDRGEYGWIWERAVENIKKPDPRARCYPDAFPCIVYVNGDFYGIFCWQLKKHRKNMNMKKNTLEHIHLDGSLSKNTVFRDTIKWGSVEVRNPKNLYNMKGYPYDGSQKSELIDETSPYYDLETDDEETKLRKQNTAKVKAMVKGLGKHYEELTALRNSGATNEEMRAAIAERFDVPSLIDYIIHNLLTNNMDGVIRNFQCFTYDGYKWFVAPYDLDGTFGYHCVVPVIMPPTNYVMGPLSNINFKSSDPMTWAALYFEQDMRDRYAEIRNKGMLSAENLTTLFENWYYSIGEENYRLEYEKWPVSPPMRDDIPNEGWEEDIPYSYANYKKASAYSSNVEYHKGDMCYESMRVWKATQTVKGVYPYKQIGCRDSIGRIPNWMKIHLETLDSYMKYTFESTIRSYTLEMSNAGWSTLCVPFQFTIPENMQVYSVTGFDEDGQLVLEAVSSPEANQPYLVKAPPGLYFLTGYTEETDEYADDYLQNGLLQGCYVEKYVPKDQYVLQNHNGKTGFYQVRENGSVQIAPNRAYLKSGNNELQAGEFSIENVDVTTVNQIEEPNTIEGIYDISGTQLPKPRKGLNIVKYSNGTTLKITVK